MTFIYKVSVKNILSGPFKNDVTGGRGRGSTKLVTNGDIGGRGSLDWW